MIKSNRKKASFPHASFRPLCNEILSVCSSTDPKLSPFLSWTRGGPDQLLVEAMSSLDEDWSGYNEPAYAYLASELLSKSDVLDLGINREQVAYAAFAESEERCRSTNRRFWSTACHRFSNGDTVQAVIHSLCVKFRNILGDFSWDEAVSRSDFGSGANVLLPRRMAHRANKIGLVRPTVTEACEPLVQCLFQHFAGWGAFKETSNSSLKVVRGNRITTVPKNYKTDRTIAIEPMFNSFFQKGIGSCIRHRLRKVGIDLTDQSHNQRAALIGSRDGTYATIDLKQASDSLASSVVESLLPGDWLDAMHRVRCQEGVLPSGDVVRYQKFSSMGNAFTFELETLVFYSLAVHCSAVMGSRLVPIVYGDDIAVDSRAAALLIEMLSYFGFETNSKKTHFGQEDRFRESCGKHYLDGRDISPFYIRNGLQSDLSRVVVCNNIRRFAARQLPWGLDKRLKTAYELALSAVPHRVRHFRIPDGYGDGAPIGDLFESDVTPVRSSRGWDGWLTDHCPEIEISRASVTGFAPVLLWLFDHDGPEGNTPPLRTVRDFAIKQLEREGTSVSEYGTKLSHLSKRRTKLFVRGQWSSAGPWM